MQTENRLVDTVGEERVGQTVSSIETYTTTTVKQIVLGTGCVTQGAQTQGSMTA